MLNYFKIQCKLLKTTHLDLKFLDKYDSFFFTLPNRSTKLDIDWQKIDTLLPMLNLCRGKQVAKSPKRENNYQ